MCEEYQVDPESFTEQWMAFSLNHLNGASPSVENLDVFARKEFSNRAANRHHAPASETKRIVAGAGLTVYGAPAKVKYPFLHKSHVLALFSKHFEVDSSHSRSCDFLTFTQTILLKVDYPLLTLTRSDNDVLSNYMAATPKVCNYFPLVNVLLT